jgi:3-oxoacyl-[acyl-carrier protein] reductase
MNRTSGAAGSDRPLANQVAVITGGSGGIGAAAAKRFADAGATLVVGYHSDADRAARLVESLSDERSRHTTMRLSMEDTESLVAAAADVEKAFGRCDILVNSAGFTRAIPHRELDALDDATFDAIMTANVRGPFATIRAFAPLMRRSGNALIVNVSSISAFTGSGSNIAYCASKAALDTMGMSLARALGPEIRVISVSPAAVNTDFVPGRDLAALQKAADLTPLRRIVEPDDVAMAILACATHLVTATGTVVVVDGGRHL